MDDAQPTRRPFRAALHERFTLLLPSYITGNKVVERKFRTRQLEI
jgi:hypothetical protein